MELPIEIWVKIASYRYDVFTRLLLTIKGLSHYLHDHNMFDELVGLFVVTIGKEQDHQMVMWQALPNGTKHGEYIREGCFSRDVIPYYRGLKHGTQVKTTEDDGNTVIHYEHGVEVWKDEGDYVATRDCILINCARPGEMCKWRRLRPGDSLIRHIEDEFAGRNIRSTVEISKWFPLAELINVDLDEYSFEVDNMNICLRRGARGVSIFIEIGMEDRDIWISGKTYRIIFGNCWIKFKKGMASMGIWTTIVRPFVVASFVDGKDLTVRGVAGETIEYRNGCIHVRTEDRAFCYDTRKKEIVQGGDRTTLRGLNMSRIRELSKLD